MTITRWTVYVGLGRERVTFDAGGNPTLVQCRYRREGHPRWRSVPQGKKRERIIADAREKSLQPRVNMA
jgi:hypothetical protein